MNAEERANAERESVAREIDHHRAVLQPWLSRAEYAVLLASADVLRRVRLSDESGGITERLPDFPPPETKP